MRYAVAALIAILPAAAAHASEREFCADRPGIGTPACTLAAGEFMAELGLVGWDHTNDTSLTEDDLTYGDVLLRAGIDERTEIELGQTAFVTTRLLDHSGGTVTRQVGAGDTTIALRRGLAGANGPAALHIYLTLPTGSRGISAGDWGAGVKLPVTLALPHGFALDLTPELGATVNASGSGRHLAWGGVIGLSHPLGHSITLEGEFAARSDDDPAASVTDGRASLSLAWLVAADWQIDAELQLGITSAAPDRSLLFGLAHRF